MSRKLESLELEFKVHHHTLIDILDDEEDLQMEQDLLDQHDEEMSILAARIQHLITNCSRSSNSTSCKVVFHKLTCLQNNLSTVSTEVSLSLLSEETNICLLISIKNKSMISRSLEIFTINFFSNIIATISKLILDTDGGDKYH